MKRVKWTLNIGLVNADQEGEIEVDDNTPPAEIEKLVHETIMEYIDYGWEIIS